MYQLGTFVFQVNYQHFNYSHLIVVETFAMAMLAIGINFFLRSHF